MIYITLYRKLRLNNTNPTENRIIIFFNKSFAIVFQLNFQLYLTKNVMVVCRFMLVKVKYMYMDLQIGYFDSQIQTEAPGSMGSYPWGAKFNVGFSGVNSLAILISYIIWKCNRGVSSYIRSWKVLVFHLVDHMIWTTAMAHVLFLFAIVLSVLKLML